KGLEVVCNVDPALPMLVGDPVRLRQILINLLGNAVKFTEKGSVAVEVKVLRKTNTEASVRLAVRDTGIGISDEAKIGIFSSFTQAARTTPRKYGGRGFGLTICRQLVELFCGSIWVESEQGVGSPFFVELCLPMAAEQAPAQAPTVLRGKRVLVVDDTPMNLT